MTRFKRSMDEQMDEQIRKERQEATYRARAAAWEAEKAEAQANKVVGRHFMYQLHSFISLSGQSSRFS